MGMMDAIVASVKRRDHMVVRVATQYMRELKERVRTEYGIDLE
jgi:hypothetical protein